MGKNSEELLRDIDRYHLRDIETKQVKLKFRSLSVALNYKNKMNFGLGHFYEVYDSLEGKIK